MKPILSIWINPRQTFEFLAERDEEKNDNMIKTLFFLTSMAAGFSSVNAFSKLFGGNFYVGLIIALLLSGLIGFFMLNSVFSFIFWGTSKLFQGKATKNEIKLALAYSLIPNLIHLIIGIIMIIPAIILDNAGLISYKHTITIFVLWILSLRILIFGLAYFNRYSYGYALLTIFIPAAFLQGLVYGIKYLIG